MPLVEAIIKTLDTHRYLTSKYLVYNENFLIFHITLHWPISRNKNATNMKASTPLLTIVFRYLGEILLNANPTENLSWS